MDAPDQPREPTAREGGSVAEVDQALALLDDLSGLPVSQQPRVFESVDGALRRALDAPATSQPPVQIPRPDLLAHDPQKDGA